MQRSQIFSVFLCCAAGMSTSSADGCRSRLVEPALDFVFEEIVELAPAVRVGRTPRGDRQFVPIVGGTFKGSKIEGKILPGGWDWQLIRGDGCTDIEANYMIQANDGVVINVSNKGSLCPVGTDGAFEVKTMAVFEAPFGRHDWLNRAAFVGTLDPVPGRNAVRIRFYQALAK